MALTVLQLRLTDTSVTEEDILPWLKLIAFAKVNKWGKIEVDIEGGKPQIGAWKPTINFKN